MSGGQLTPVIQVVAQALHQHSCRCEDWGADCEVGPGDLRAAQRLARLGLLAEPGRKQ